MAFGDKVRMEAVNSLAKSPFGIIEQTVIKAPGDLTCVRNPEPF